MEKFKYPSTPHLPGSGSMTKDDSSASLETLKLLQSGIELVVTEKMDGGNISLYRDDFHARSLDAKAQPWDFAAKAKWAEIRYSIPYDMRISGESVHARRSVAYDDLPGPILVFGVWRDRQLLSWNDTEAITHDLGLPTVPVIYRGADFNGALEAWRESGRTVDDSEGFVVRDAGPYSSDDFALHMAKWVRANHVRTSAEWRKHSDFDRNGYAS